MHKLITIPPSHYCDKARWGLDLAGVAFVEEGWPPMIHWAATRLASGTKTVPILRLPSGRYLTDSSSILHYLHQNYPAAATLYPSDAAQLVEVQNLETLFTDKLGVYTRVACYAHLFKRDDWCVQVLSQGLAGWRKALFTLLWPLIKFLMVKGLRVSDKAGEICMDKTRAVFAEVDRRLADGRQFLVGDQLTAADITFAAMVSPLLLPDEYPVKLIPFDQTPPEYPAHELRKTAAGQHALRMYRLYRRRAAEAGGSAAAPATTS